MDKQKIVITLALSFIMFLDGAAMWTLVLHSVEDNIIMHVDGGLRFFKALASLRGADIFLVFIQILALLGFFGIIVNLWRTPQKNK